MLKKYIVLDGREMKLFDRDIYHVDVALKEGLTRVTSAAFADIKRCRCFGGSNSLGLEAKPGDEELLRRKLEQGVPDESEQALVAV